MIAQKTSTDQVKRFRAAGLKFPPEDVREIIAALATHAVSADHAERGVAQWIENNPNWPTPADIIAVLNTISAESAADRESRVKCECCAGTGYVIVERNGAEGAVRCTHAPQRTAPRRWPDE